jgi:toxin ParE1/3/4
MSYPVLLSKSAATDLREIHAYLAQHRSVDFADALVRNLRSRVVSLAELPNRGAIPQELLDWGVTDIRQLVEGPYRIIYEVRAEHVYVHVIADGRRDMRELLNRRLLNP